MWRLLRTNRSFAALFVAVLVSYCGDWFATVSLLGEVGDLTDDSPVATSAILACQFLPSLLAAPLAGPVADRFDRKKVMVIASLVQAVAAVGFLSIGPGRLWVAYVSVVAIATAAAFFGPAASAALPNLVEPDDLATANSMMSGTWGAMLAVGSGLGGVFAAAFGRDAAFVADGVSFVIAAGLIGTIARATSERRSGRAPMRPIRDTAEAIAFARSDRGLLALLASKSGLGVATGVVGLLAVLSSDVFDAGDSTTGALLAARGVGALVGPFLVVRWLGAASLRRTLTACAWCAVVYGAGYFAVALSPVAAVAVVFILLAHLGGGAQWTVSTIGLQTRTPDALLGRIIAADFALATGSIAMSTLLAGGLAEVVGVRAALAVFAIVAVAWGVFYLALAARTPADRPGL